MIEPIIVRGAPDDAELAALTVALAALSDRGDARPPSAPAVRGWRSLERRLNPPVRPGAGAWVASGRP